MRNEFFGLTGFFQLVTFPEAPLKLCVYSASSLRLLYFNGNP